MWLQRHSSSSGLLAGRSTTSSTSIRNGGNRTNRAFSPLNVAPQPNNPFLLVSSTTSASASATTEETVAVASSTSAPSPTTQLTVTESQQQIIMTGPSLLYRLIAQPSKKLVEWDIILQRAQSHPHEACFYDPNAGGHVYALHRLLRHTGDDETGDEGDDSSSSSRGGGRPPLEVVEAVMRACPRAVTRKQMVDEDDLMIQESDTNNDGGGDDDMEGQAADAQMNVPPPHAVGENNNNVPIIQPNENDDDDNNINNNNMNVDQEEEGENNQQQPEPDENNNDNNNNPDLDDVRFEYPLAIACECEQDGEVVRLLASYISKSKPVYRSEVFRSLDFASLPSHLVRILLEEYAGCVLERGNSEVTEGDDDDCPLEQILFWWDDPDMMNMQEEILLYPNCNMRDDLCDLYAKLSMMLYAASMGTMIEYDKSKESFQVLHHLLRIVSEGGINDTQFPSDFAHAVLLLAKFIQKERASMFRGRDKSGSLPIHIAVSGKRLLKPNDPRIYDNERTNEEEGDADDEMDEADDNQPNVPAGDEAHQQNNIPLIPPAEEQDEDDEDDDEGDDGNSANDDDTNEDIDTSSADIEIIKLLLDQYPASIRLRDTLSGSLPVHLAIRHNPRAIEAIEYFIQLYPLSVSMPDGNGRLPLHLALLSKSPTWKTIVDMSPRMLEARDPVTGLLPFQLAAILSKPDDTCDNENHETVEIETNEETELDSLSTSFSLLRMSPCLASGLGIDQRRSQSLMEQQIMVQYKYKPRVTKLEEENERLRRKVEELESRLRSLSTVSPHVKKRKSSADCC